MLTFKMRLQDVVSDSTVSEVGMTLSLDDTEFFTG